MSLELFIRKTYRFLWAIWYRYIRGMRNLGNNVSFGFRVTIDSPPCVTIEDNVVLRDDILIHIQGDKSKNKVVIGENSYFERKCFISAAEYIFIGKNVLFGPNVFVSDHIHAYKDISIPILDQGIAKVSPVSIGDESWLGVNVAVLPGVTIGKHCVIGSNSVVTQSIPDYSVAVGIPAKIVKHYNLKSKRWVRN